MPLIATYAVIGIHDVKRDVAAKIERSHQALMAYGKEPGETLDALTTELAQTTELLAGAIGVTVEDYREHREESYKQLKQGADKHFKTT